MKLMLEFWILQWVGFLLTLLARRWEGALLVNVDNFTLQRLMDNGI
jgi:hypothetical protein